MNLRQTLQNARANNRSAFIPFIMAGDPSLDQTEEMIVMMDKAHVDALELGIPFSDPVADGETIQKAAERALKNGVKPGDVLSLVQRVRERGVTMPICLFTYLNPVFRLGYGRFAQSAVEAGAQGALIVDLPPEEAREYLNKAKHYGLETIFLASPTTSAPRLKLIDRASTGFVYYISREGVTGMQDALPQNLADKLSTLRIQLTGPFVVGFGISESRQIGKLCGEVDGIVVGSALVKMIGEKNTAFRPAFEQRIKDFVLAARG